MPSAKDQRLLLFSLLFIGAVVFDVAKYLIAGKPTIINWESIVHPAWVIMALIFLFVSAFIPQLKKIGFWLYLTIFVASLLNVYLEFTQVLTYWCMIFNLVLVSTFFFAFPRSSSSRKH